jgi:hypothetical protein
MKPCKLRSRRSACHAATHLVARAGRIRIPSSSTTSAHNAARCSASMGSLAPPLFRIPCPAGFCGRRSFVRGTLGTAVINTHTRFVAFIWQHSNKHLVCVMGRLVHTGLGSSSLVVLSGHRRYVVYIDSFFTATKIGNPQPVTWWRAGTLLNQCRLRYVPRGAGVCAGACARMRCVWRKAARASLLCPSCYPGCDVAGTMCALWPLRASPVAHS